MEPEHITMLILGGPPPAYTTYDVGDGRIWSNLDGSTRGSATLRLNFDGSWDEVVSPSIPGSITKEMMDDFRNCIHARETSRKPKQKPKPDMPQPFSRPTVWTRFDKLVAEVQLARKGAEEENPELIKLALDSIINEVENLKRNL